MGRSHAAMLCLAALAAAPAAAGDYADREIIGFSPDGAYFAFEEYGVQDGSGFPYANIYVLDTARDAWVTGTPVRVLIEGDAPPLSETRFEAKDLAHDILQAHRTYASGLHVLANPVTETSADPHNVSFLPRRTTPPSGDHHVLAIQEYPLPADGCPDMGVAYVGFRLTLTTSAGSRVLNRDTRIPSSRNCPTGYGISDVYTFYPEDGRPAVAVILVNVFSIGFEGPDRRFIAIPARL